jgi:HK97 family phage prohead protease
MAETSPGDVRATERLHAYWVHGEGAAKIGWSQPGDYDRCVVELGKYLKDPHGYCAKAHKEATGMWPAQHAAMEKHAGRAAMATDTKAKPYGDVTYADPKNGKYPIDTEEHARAAWAYVNMPKNASQYPMNGVTLSEVKDRIAAACKRFGIDVSGSSDAGDSGKSASRSEMVRDYPLEDLHIVRSEHGGDGRTVEAFAAVFNTETEIMDHQGHYLEVISPTAFNKRLSDLRRSKAGFGGVKVIFNHGRSPDGVPVERFMMPVAKPVSIEVTDRGLLTRSRYFNTPLGNEVLELISEGGITSQSFVGKIIHSDPEVGRYGRYRPDSSGRLTTVHRTELGLREYGGVLFAAYEGAEVLGVRMSTPGTWEPGEHEEHDFGTSPDGEAAAGEPLAEGEHSARYHQHALYLLRAQEQREKAGLVW